MYRWLLKDQIDPGETENLKCLLLLEEPTPSRREKRQGPGGLAGGREVRAWEGIKRLIWAKAKPPGQPWAYLGKISSIEHLRENSAHLIKLLRQQRCQQKPSIAATPDDDTAEKKEMLWLAGSVVRASG